MRRLALLAVAAVVACTVHAPPANTETRGAPLPRASVAPTSTTAPSAPIVVPENAGTSRGSEPPIVPNAMAASVPAKPPYDLAADLAARTELAKRELGKGVHVTVVEGVFLVVGPRGGLGLMTGALGAYFNNRFRKRPERAVSVYLFSAQATYQRYCRQFLGEPCISVFGFYRHDLRRIVMSGGVDGTLTHELIHPIIEVDFPEAPIWINEGIASLFEAPALPRPGEIHGVKNWRLPRLHRGLDDRSEREQARLDRLFRLSDDDFRGEREDLYYSVARYVCQWLDGRGQLWPFYQRWRDTVAEDPTGEKAFVAITSMTPTAAHELWRRWARAL